MKKRKLILDVMLTLFVVIITLSACKDYNREYHYKILSNFVVDCADETIETEVYHKVCKDIHLLLYGGKIEIAIPIPNDKYMVCEVVIDAVHPDIIKADIPKLIKWHCAKSPQGGANPHILNHRKSIKELYEIAR